MKKLNDFLTLVILLMATGCTFNAAPINIHREPLLTIEDSANGNTVPVSAVP